MFPSGREPTISTCRTVSFSEIISDTTCQIKSKSLHFIYIFSYFKPLQTTSKSAVLTLELSFRIILISHKVCKLQR